MKSPIANWGGSLVVVVVWLCVGVCGMSTQECLGLFDTHAQGVYVCYSHPDLVPALQIAEKIGRSECQEAFKMERWNCSNFSILKAPNITKSATKEAAYVHALSFAAIAHSIAKVCAQGCASSCSCDEDHLDPPETNSGTEYEMGCSENVTFGVQFARNFLLKGHPIADSREKEAKIHNLMIGAQVVQERTAQTRKACICIGISGSCTIFSCQNILPDFAVLARDILNIYRRPTHSVNADASDTPEVLPSARHTQENEDKLLFFTHESPDYCTQNDTLGSPGTAGRECIPHSDAPNSCNYLCKQCNRNVTKYEHVYTETCNCEFIYCCDIHCYTCSKTREIHVCV